jgi:hypothetical protein
MDRAQTFSLYDPPATFPLKYCCGDGVVNRKIDADTTHRRHRVRTVANAQQPIAIPSKQPVCF